MWCRPTLLVSHSASGMRNVLAVRSSLMTPKPTPMEDAISKLKLRDATHWHYSSVPYFRSDDVSLNQLHFVLWHSLLHLDFILLRHSVPDTVRHCTHTMKIKIPLNSELKHLQLRSRGEQRSPLQASPKTESNQAKPVKGPLALVLRQLDSQVSISSLTWYSIIAGKGRKE